MHPVDRYRLRLLTKTCCKTAALSRPSKIRACRLHRSFADRTHRITQFRQWRAQSLPAAWSIGKQQRAGEPASDCVLPLRQLCPLHKQHISPADERSQQSGQQHCPTDAVQTGSKHRKLSTNISKIPAMRSSQREMCVRMASPPYFQIILSFFIEKYFTFFLKSVILNKEQLGVCEHEQEPSRRPNGRQL